MSDILEKLIDLHKQATVERSHFYVGACCREAIGEIERLRAALTAMVKTRPIAEMLVDGAPELEPLRVYLRGKDSTAAKR